MNFVQKKVQHQPVTIDGENTEVVLAFTLSVNWTGL